MKLREIYVIFWCGMCNKNVGAQQNAEEGEIYRGRMVFKSLITPAMEGAAHGILCLDAVRVIVSPNVVEGQGEGGIGAVESRINFKQG